MRGLALFLPAALLVACASAAVPPRSAAAPRPGYVCTVGQQLEPGTSIALRLDAEGRPIDADMSWLPPHVDFTQPRISVRWGLRGSADLRTGDGSVFIVWQRLEDFRHRGRLPSLRMELTTVVRPRPWPEPAIASDFHEGGGGYHLGGNLADFAAFARGAPALFLVLRRRSGQVVAQAGIDPALFARAVTETDAALAEMQRMRADYRSRCEFTNDIDPGIVVT
ncbi:MAG TPA: hypothetical protein VEW26_06760 [Allosphingosinicella sp.]|nr:hypothetical protein [Allosphingosinicella sp.]